MLEENLKTIKDAKLDIELLIRQNKKLCLENDLKIDKLRVKIEDEEITLEKNLKESGKRKLECKLGYCSFRDMPDKWIYQDDILMKFISSLPAKYSSLFYKVTTTIRKADLKKKIMDDNFSLFDNGKIKSVISGKELFITDELKTCREVKGIEIEPQEPKFNYKIKEVI